jgi:hypothetical protein
MHFSLTMMQERSSGMKKDSAKDKKSVPISPPCAVPDHTEDTASAGKTPTMELRSRKKEQKDGTSN